MWSELHSPFCHCICIKEESVDWQVSEDEMAQKSTDCLWDSLYSASCM